MNVFILNLFELESEKGSKYDERTLFYGSLQKLELSVKHYLPKDAHLHFSGLFQFQVIFGLFHLVLDIKIKLTYFIFYKNLKHSAGSMG